MKIGKGEKIFRVGNYTFLAFLSFLALYPIYYVVISSFSDPITGNSAYFWIKDFYVMNYWLVFTTKGIWQAYGITVLRVAMGVPLMLIVTGGMAYALTRPNFIARKPIIIIMLLTMFFSGGLIPLYLTLKTVGLIDSFWVLILPFVFNVWTMIIMKTSFQGIPNALTEAATIDGANEMYIFMKIILPLSIPMMAALGLFHAVLLWNEWFAGAFYISDMKLVPLQTFLQFKVLRGGIAQMIYEAVGYTEELIDPTEEGMIIELQKISPKSLESAYIVVSTLPIMCVYPFLQKYFVKGVLIGSVKG